MQRYSEKTFMNSGIDIDVKKGTVNFKDYDKESSSENLVVLFLIIFLSSFTISFLLFFIFILIDITFDIGLWINPFIVLGYVLVFPLVTCGILWLFFRDWLMKINPKLQAKIFSKVGISEKVFTKADSREIIIPRFENVILHYKAYEDFGNYLKNVLVDGNKYHVIKKNKREEEIYWSARFIFSKIPKKGKLIVRWN